MNLSQPDIHAPFNEATGSEYHSSLANRITKLASQISAATYQLLKYIAAFDNCQGWAEVGVKSCAHWLAYKCAMRLGSAREKVRVAHCLEGLPLINESFKAGQLSYSKVRALTRVATDENEAYLLEIAHRSNANEVELAVRQFQQVGEVDTLETLMEKRALSCYQDYDGMWVIKAKLPQDSGALVVNALKAIADKQKDVPAETSKLEMTDKPTLAQKEADALCTMAEFYIAGGSDGEHKSLAGHERCQVVLHMDVETLKHEHACGCELHDHSHKPARLDNHWISSANAKRLSCDASLLTVLEDKDGNVLNVGRNARTVTPQLKRALDIRDRTCQFPGCCESHYVDYHHVQHWAEGGETSKRNLIKLCHYHHDVLHEGKYVIETQGDRNNPTFVFKTPDGQVLQAMDEHRQHRDTTVKGTLYDFDQRWPDINSETIQPELWDEELNYSMVMNDMLARTISAPHNRPSDP